MTLQIYEDFLMLQIFKRLIEKDAVACFIITRDGRRDRRHRGRRRLCYSPRV